MNRKAFHLVIILLCTMLSACAGINGAARGNNSSVRASTDIFKW